MRAGVAVLGVAASRDPGSVLLAREGAWLVTLGALILFRRQNEQNLLTWLKDHLYSSCGIADVLFDDQTCSSSTDRCLGVSCLPQSWQCLVQSWPSFAVSHPGQGHAGAVPAPRGCLWAPALCRCALPHLLLLFMSWLCLCSCWVGFSALLLLSGVSSGPGRSWELSFHGWAQSSPHQGQCPRPLPFPYPDRCAPVICLPCSHTPGALSLGFTASRSCCSCQLPSCWATESCSGWLAQRQLHSLTLLFLLCTLMVRAAPSFGTDHPSSLWLWGIMFMIKRHFKELNQPPALKPARSHQKFPKRMVPDSYLHFSSRLTLV